MITPDKIRATALKEFSHQTSIGADWVSFREIAQAPDDALMDLGNRIHQIFLNVAWPTQIHVNLISLLGKKNGNTRCIAVATTLYRLVMALCKSVVRSWDIEVGHHNDSA